MPSQILRISEMTEENELLAGDLSFYAKKIGPGEYETRSIDLALGISAYFKVCNAKDYGVVGDGVTDDTTAFIAAMTDAQSQGCFLDLNRLTVLITGDITFLQGFKLRNGSIKLNTSSSIILRNSQQWESITVDANGNDYAITEQVTPGVTNGCKYSTFSRVNTTGAAVSDWYLMGYHFMSKWEQCNCRSNCTSYGFRIDNVDGVPNPDMSFSNCYCDGPAGGWYMELCSVSLVACACDGATIPPFASYNSFIVMNACSAETMNRGMSLGSSLVEMAACYFDTTAGGGFHEIAASTYAMIETGGGTYRTSINIRGCTFKNNTTLPMAVVRTSGAVPLARVSGCSLINNSTGSIRYFYYGSAGSPSVESASRTCIGNEPAYVSYSGIDPTGSTTFPIYIQGTNKRFICPKNGTIRHLAWREIGANVAGATTKLTMYVYDDAGNVKTTFADIISIAGTTSNTAETAKRKGYAIIDSGVVRGDAIYFDVTTAGMRANSGFAITVVIDFNIESDV